MSSDMWIFPPCSALSCSREGKGGRISLWSPKPLPQFCSHVRPSCSSFQNFFRSFRVGAWRRSLFSDRPIRFKLATFQNYFIQNRESCRSCSFVMESKRELYKQRGRKGLADRGVRVKLREESSRSKRENLLLSKRRIPLAAIQEDEKGTPSFSVFSE